MAESSIVLITGGNTGIGYESVKALYTSQQPHTILMGSRSLEKANDSIAKLKGEVSESKSEVVPIQIDIEDDASIENAFKEVQSKYGRLDSLINNAGTYCHFFRQYSRLTIVGGSFDGIMRNDPSPKGIRAAWDKTYSLNVTSTQVVTDIFAPLLIASPHPRLLFVTSGISSLGNCSGGLDNKLINTPPPKGWPKPPSMTQTAYRSSKTAMNMMMLHWAKTLSNDGVKVFAVSPGFLATGLGGIGAEMMKKFGAGDPSIGGIFIKDVVEGKRDEHSGKVINKDGIQPW
jgi:NAD(P)-dependent dehydrogenase (short-subunit alcohol dehydrogenase family)